MSDKSSGSGNVTISDISGGETNVGNIVTGTVTGDVIGRDKITYNTYSSSSEKEELNQFLKNAIRAYDSYIHRILSTTPSIKEPYLFLYPFSIEHHKIFFGRKKIVEKLYQVIMGNPLTVLHARSGAGKSSLLNAGLGPRLVENYATLPIFARTKNDPISAIINEIAKADETLIQPNLLSKVPLQKVLKLAKNLTGAKDMVIILDQFEEIFTQTPRQVQAAIIDALADCIQDKSLPVHFVLSIRREYLGDLDDFRMHLPRILDNRYPLPPMPPTDLKAAITEPIKRLRIKISYKGEFLDELIKTLSRADMDLTTLQIVCTRLYEVAQAKNNKVIDSMLFKELGGLSEILAGYIDYALEPLDPMEKALAEQVMIILVDSAGRRKMTTFESITQEISGLVEFTPNGLERVINKLLSMRLLRATEQDKQHYELAHDHVAAEVVRRISPSNLKVKQAQELLGREIDNWRYLGKLIEPKTLLMIYQKYESGILQNLNADEIALLLMSAIYTDERKMAKSWIALLRQLDQASRQAVLQILTDLSQRINVQVSGLAPDRKAAKQRDLTQLYQTLQAKFGSDELRILCIYLDIEYDNLPGEFLDAKIRAMVDYLTRYGHIPKFVDTSRILYPDISWDNMIEIVTDPIQVSQPTPSKELLRNDSFIVSESAARVLILLQGVGVLSEEEPRYIDITLPPEQEYDFATIYQLLSAGFSSEEIRWSLCYDYFPIAFYSMSEWMPKSIRIDILLEYCRRSNEIPTLLSIIRGLNPQKYAWFESALKSVTHPDFIEGPSDNHYYLKNIRLLLITGFFEDELRRFVFNTPDFQAVYNDLPLPQNTGKYTIVDEIIYYADRQVKFDVLLDWARRKNPAQYEHHQPYYDLDKLTTFSNSFGSIRASSHKTRFFIKDVREILLRFFGAQGIVDLYFEFDIGDGHSTWESKDSANQMVDQLLDNIENNLRWDILLGAIKAHRPFLLRELRIAPPTPLERAKLREVAQRLFEAELLAIAQKLNVPRDTQEILNQLGPRVFARELIQFLEQQNKLDYLVVLLAHIAPAWLDIPVSTALKNLLEKHFDIDALHVLAFDIKLHDDPGRKAEKLTWINLIVKAMATEPKLTMLVEAVINPNSFVGIRPAVILRRVATRTIIPAMVLDELVYDHFSLRSALDDIPHFAKPSVKIRILIEYAERRVLLSQLTLLLINEQHLFGEELIANFVKHYPTVVDKAIAKIAEMGFEWGDIPISIERSEKLYDKLTRSEPQLLETFLKIIFNERYS